ncbi:FimV/HubP family polar landmark protein [Variovorax sp. HJSM1_2]|uniref:FimV/HubP family polar landmark protein n=1 Tax=Variovorax sp. HJSM1_2 TaxID=3366263 RepID=UPI003BF471B9
MASLSGWKATAVALAAAAALSFPASDAQALVLGRLNVLSALGEPLQAEIDVPQLSNEEADSLRTELASPDAFRAAGLEYNSALIGMQLTLQRRPGGRAVIRITSNRPVNDPFVDLILQLTWASGRVVRDYTVLLDPPAMRQGNTASNAANNTPAQIPAAPAPAPAPRTAAPAPSTQAAAPTAPRAVETPRPPAPPAARASATPAPAPAPVRAPAPAPATPAAAASEPKQQVTVKPGDTASRIAARTKPANVSLDQMLVALLRSNPDAFIQNNVNRMKAGSVLDVPSASQAAAPPAAEASQTITAQARDFDSFRRALAGHAPSVRTAEASRSASGRVQTQVDEKKPSTTAPDKLTLSKGGVQGQLSEEQIAREKAARDAADRVAELSKNISELNKLGAASTAAAAPPAAAPAPAASAPAGADVPAASASAPAEAAAAPASGATPAVTASAPEAAAAPAPAPVASAPAAPAAPLAAAAPAPAEESSWIDTLTENPLLPAAGAALIALLAALGIYRARERKKAAQLDSSFLESKMSADSFFGSSGGQQVDTSAAEDGEGPASSLSYSPSQLDAAGDVDPVAEADVYLAYGRDLQAEEILREALRNNPERLAIHAKLLDIYAKRRDVSAFASQAVLARDLTNRLGSGQGHEWTRIADIGRQLDPANPLYRVESNASSASQDATAHIPLSFPVPTEAAPLAAGLLQADAKPNAAAAPQETDANTLDFDLDLGLDLDLDKQADGALPAKETAEPEISLDLSEPAAEPAIDLALPMPEAPDAKASEDTPTMLALGDDDLLAMAPTPAPGLPEVDFDLGEPEAPVAAAAPLATPPAAEPAATDYNNAALTVPAALEPSSPAPEASPLDFDLNLDIDLSPASDVPPPAPLDDELPELDAELQHTPQDSDMIEFDLGSLSLDLGDSTPAAAPIAAAASPASAEAKPAPNAASTASATAEPEEEVDLNDPLATKLALAEEFHSIGDEDGARALAEEVMEEATGSLRAKAERFLAGMA